MADIVINGAARDTLIYCLNAAAAHAELQLIYAEHAHAVHEAPVETINQWTERVSGIKALMDEVTK
jgi:hypothetical protein